MGLEVGVGVRARARVRTCTSAAVALSRCSSGDVLPACLSRTVLGCAATGRVVQQWNPTQPRPRHSRGSLSTPAWQHSDEYPQ